MYTIGHNMYNMCKKIQNVKKKILKKAMCQCKANEPTNTFTQQIRYEVNTDNNTALVTSLHQKGRENVREMWPT